MGNLPPILCDMRRNHNAGTGFNQWRMKRKARHYRCFGKATIVLRGISEAVNFSAIPLKGGAGLGLHA
jgi:hypothetical protein